MTVDSVAALWDLYYVAPAPLDPPEFRPYWDTHVDDLAAGLNRAINSLTWDDGPRVGRHPRLGVIDTENMVAEVVTMYHDYPGADQFDQIDARDCA
jgi:hypothetical protein